MQKLTSSILLFILILAFKSLFGQYYSNCRYSIEGRPRGIIDSVKYFHTVDNDTISGKIPTINNYTGLVMEFMNEYETKSHVIRFKYKKEYETSGYIITVEDGKKYADSIFYGNYCIASKRSEGIYINGEKTGLFSYYKGGHTNDYSVEYRQDSIITKPLHCGGYRFVCTADSSFCKGYLESLWEKQEIEYICLDDTCRFYMKNKKPVVLKTDQKDLEFTLQRFFFNGYNREIRKALLMEQQLKKTE